MTFEAPTLFDEEPTPETPRPAPPPTRSGFDYRIERSADSAKKWTKEQTELVDYTIILVARRGRITQTGEYAKSSRGGSHDHGQRLTVWRRVQS